MKKLSILCTFLFVIGLMASSAFAQECATSADCDDFVSCTDDRCDDGSCVNTLNDSICDDGIDCNGEELCDSENDCQPGDSQCEEGQACDIETNECVFVGSVDIKPGSCQNPLNVRSQGVLPVAILGTEDFDVETINPDTIMITREGFDSVAPIRYRFGYDDVGAPPEREPCDCDDLDEDNLNVDDIMDLTLKFRVPELVEGLGLKEVESREIIPLTIMVGTDNGTFIGEDCVKIINKLKWWDDTLEKIKKPKKPKKPDEE